MNLAPASHEFHLSRFSLAVILLFGLSLLLIHLGSGRVLTRHEVLAAQPAREMLHSADWRRWILPTLAGVPREAKPPGMMWLIAMSIYVFRSEQEWVARLPSALAGLAVAVMTAKLAARWFGNRIGRLAGLIQLTSVFIIMQAKLAEADMPMGAAVCAAMYLLAEGVIDSPYGLQTGRGRRIGFWLALAAAFLLKGPIGPMFVGLAIVCFAFVRRDQRILRFLADPIGITACLLLVIAWPLAAWRLDPGIWRVWNSEAVGTATGKFGSDPIYYYLLSVPVMLLPWTPLTILGLCRGPNAELAGPVVRQADRAALWRFLLCWFVPGFVLLSLGIKLKSHHYGVPILPPLAIPTALGMDYFVRRQCSRAQGLIWPFFLAGCAVAALLVWKLPSIEDSMKPGMVELLGLFAAGGLLALHFERSRRPALVVASYFLTAWVVCVGVQTWLMPAQDDLKYEADFARTVNGLVPPGDTIYLLGDREEEQEAEYAYYLRFPMQRLATAADFAAIVRDSNGAATYAIASTGFLPQLAGDGDIQTLTTSAGLHKGDSESDRLQFLRVTGR